MWWVGVGLEADVGWREPELGTAKHGGSTLGIVADMGAHCVDIAPGALDRVAEKNAPAAARFEETIDRLMEASGGRGIFLSNPIQRAWRDIHAMRAHIGNNPERAAAVFGRSEFGLPPTDIRF